VTQRFHLPRALVREALGMEADGVQADLSPPARSRWFWELRELPASRSPSWMPPTQAKRSGPPVRQFRCPTEETRMDRDQALAIVREHIAAESLVNHMLAVEAAMRAYAPEFGGDADEWGLAGLLHDYDWEIHPTLEEHPQAGASLLRRGPEPVVRCILSHAEHTGVPLDPDGEGAVRLRRDYRADHRRGAGAPVALAA
jgi:hypothetical protein